MANRQIAEDTLMDEDEINLLDYWRVLVKRKLLIGIIVGAVFAGSIIYSLTLPPIYASTASIFPPQQEGGMSGIASQLPGGLGALAGGFLGVSAPVDQWLGILKSEATKDAIIKRFDLMKILKANTMVDTRKAVGGMIKVSKAKEGIISITVEDEDPQRAAAPANEIV